MSERCEKCGDSFTCHEHSFPQPQGPHSYYDEIYRLRAVVLTEKARADAAEAEVERLVEIAVTEKGIIAAQRDALREALREIRQLDGERGIKLEDGTFPWRRIAAAALEARDE